MKLFKQPESVDIHPLGGISVPWSTENRSGIAYHEPEHFNVMEQFSDQDVLALHIVSQAQEIFELTARIAKLEGIIERLAGAFGPEEE